MSISDCSFNSSGDVFEAKKEKKKEKKRESAFYAESLPCKPSHIKDALANGRRIASHDSHGNLINCETNDISRIVLVCFVTGHSIAPHSHSHHDLGQLKKVCERERGSAEETNEV